MEEQRRQVRCPQNAQLRSRGQRLFFESLLTAFEPAGKKGSPANLADRRQSGNRNRPPASLRAQLAPAAGAQIRQQFVEGGQTQSVEHQKQHRALARQRHQAAREHLFDRHQLNAPRLVRQHIRRQVTGRQLAKTHVFPLAGRGQAAEQTAQRPFEPAFPEAQGPAAQRLPGLIHPGRDLRVEPAGRGERARSYGSGLLFRQPAAGLHEQLDRQRLRFSCAAQPVVFAQAVLV